MKRVVLCSVLCCLASGAIFAQLAENPFVYDNVSDQRQSCYGIAGRDASYCDDVLDFNDRQMCSGLAASSQAPCFSMTNRNLQLTCFGLAFAPNFPSNCRDITDAGLRDFCFSAASWGSQGTCSLVSDAADHALCQALTYRDSSYCAAIANANDHQFCLAVSVHDSSFCSAIAPSPGAGGPYTVDEGDSVEVTASAGADSGASYAWDLDGDGSFETPGQIAIFPAAALDGPGSREISVQITGSGGATATYTATVSILNVPPEAAFNAPATVNPGGSINLSLTGPVDAGADLPTLEYAFDCGSGYGAFSATSTANCPAPGGGNVTVQGQVRDKDGGASSYSATVTITDPSVPPGSFAAPASNDTTFVVDQGPGLDTGCFASGDHSLIINIPVTRVVGEKFSLVRNGLMQATATLRLPAFDVDFAGGGGINPERDRVYFNGIPVPAQFLTGQSDGWALNTFTIDSTWINFPFDPGYGNTPAPAMNTVRIDIDTGNTEIPSCTSVDWAALSIRVARPVLLVHGFLVANEWGTWQFRLSSMGLPNYTADVGTLSSIHQNGLRLAAQVPILLRSWGVDSLTILAHSKGGLDSRDYVENSNTVPALLQIASPNRGTPLADLVHIADLIGIGRFVDFLAPGLRDMTIENMAVYNLFHGRNPRTQYVSLAGEYRFSGFFSFIPNGLLSLVFGGANDLVVPAWSARGLGYAQHITYKSKGGNHQAKHYKQTPSVDIANLLLPYLKAQAGSSVLPAAGFSSSAATRAIKAASEEDEPAPALNTTQTTADTIAPGQIRTQDLYVDGPEPIALTLLHGAGELSLSVISPSGVRYDSSVPADDPDVHFESVDGDDFHVQLFVVNSPDVGTWTFEVSAPDTADGPQAYALTGVLPESPIHLAAATDRSIYHRGDPIVVRASLTNGSAPVAGASVGATIRQGESSPAAFTLVDDGTGDDLHAGDGIYSGRFAATAQEGLYEILVSAAGPATAPFHRERLLQATVSASTSRINGTYSDHGDDTGADGLFDDLVVEVGMDVTEPRSYRMLGELADADGTLIATATAAADLNAGTETVSLRFDGASLYQHGVDGPYLLRVVRVAEEDGEAILPLDELRDAYTTASYDHRQFQHPALAAFGQSVTTEEDTPVDLTLGGESAEPGALGFSVLTPPSHGLLSGTAPQLTYTPEADFNGTDVLTFHVSNGTGDSEPAMVFLTVSPVNDPPVLAPIADLVMSEGTTAQVAVSASDVDDDDLHMTLSGAPAFATLTDNGDGTGTIVFAPGFNAAGTYHPAVAVGDGAVSDTATFTLTVDDDGEGGFVTGGGWLTSPAGADPAHPALAGRMSFSFAAKYKPGAAVPTGQTELQCKPANLNFHSESYEWLVVSGARAQLKGVGTINGRGSYGFLITAIDGKVAGGGGVDKLRVKIWDRTTGGIVYDTQAGAADNSNPTTSIEGGSIVVHSR